MGYKAIHGGVAQALVVSVYVLACHIRHVELAGKAFVVCKLVPHLLYFVLLDFFKDGGSVDGPHILEHLTLVILHAEAAVVTFVQLIWLDVCLLDSTDA